MVMQRDVFLKRIRENFRINRIVALLGPRQCGKTTLAKQFCQEISNFSRANYFDLENPVDLQRLESPNLAFLPLKGLIVIDEVQRRPDLFSVLRYISDENPDKQFLILGSASRELIQQSSESLAGRISYIEVTPFSASELPQYIEKLWLVGGYPKSFLASETADSFAWLREYIRTYTEHDLPSLGINIQHGNIRRFWLILSHYHGQTFNSAEIANSLGISSPTVKYYLNILNATFMVRILTPWYTNLKKRQVKSPKVYIRDSGIFHYLQNIESKEALFTAPKLGASWEGFALEAVLNHSNTESNNAFFWATHNGAELDLLIIKGPNKIGLEFKYSDAPALTSSMKIALVDLNLDRLIVIYPGSQQYMLAENVYVIGLQNFLQAGKDAIFANIQPAPPGGG